MKNTIELHGFNQYSISYCEAIGLSKCFAEYAEKHAGSSIMDGGIGFNPNSGYTYIALDDGVCICSKRGSDIEYLHTDFETGEETFFHSFEEYTEFLESLEGEQD